MEKDDHFLVGSLLKTIGIKGEILLKFNNDLPEKIQKLESILISVDDKLVPFFIEEIKVKSSNTIIVQLEGLSSDRKSSEFIGSDFYISERQSNFFNLEINDFIDVKGYSVFDQDMNLIGEVIEYIDIPKNPVLNVKTKGEGLLLPANNELIIEIDDDLKEIKLKVPDGLININ